MSALTWTPELQASEYESLPWRRRLPLTKGRASWRHGWVVLYDNDRHAILERRARPGRLHYDVLRVSRWADWSREDPQQHLFFGSHLPGESWLVGDLVEIEDGLFVFRVRPTRWRSDVEHVGRVLRSISWIEEVDR